MLGGRIDKEKRTTYMPLHKAQELAAALMADEMDGWQYVAIEVNPERGYGIVRVIDDSGETVGEL